MPPPYDSAGHRALRNWFRLHSHLTKAAEAQDMGMSRQQLDHILSGRRRPTLEQAVEIYKHTGVEPHRWSQ